MKLNKSIMWPLALAAWLPVSTWGQEASAGGAEEAGSASATSAQLNALPPNAREVVKLSQSGADDQVVTAFVKSSATPYSLTADEIISLKNIGVSSPVISAMVSHDNELLHKGRGPQYNYEQRLYGPAGQGSSVAPLISEPQIPNAPTMPNAATVPDAPKVTVPESAPTAPPATVVQQSPPAPQVEVVPVAPGPDYYWVPGYWTWRGHVWVWMRGYWAFRPYHGAVWIGGTWVRHGHGWVWMGGHWR